VQEHSDCGGRSDWPAAGLLARDWLVGSCSSSHCAYVHAARKTSQTQPQPQSISSEVLSRGQKHPQAIVITRMSYCISEQMQREMSCKHKRSVLLSFTIRCGNWLLLPQHCMAVKLHATCPPIEFRKGNRMPHCLPALQTQVVAARDCGSASTFAPDLESEPVTVQAHLLSAHLDNTQFSAQPGLEP
jgi:hypothetical protein